MPHLIRPILLIGLLVHPFFLKAQAPVIQSFSPARASLETVVGIYGDNFTGATEVYFGGTPAIDFQIVSDSIINAIVGFGSSGEVTVVTANGSAALPGFVFVPGPAITGFSPDSAHFGDTITIHGLYLQDVMAVYFGDSSAQSFTVAGDTLIQAVVGNGESGSVYVADSIGDYEMPGFTFTGPAIDSFKPSNPLPGAIVRIHGRYLDGATQVWFGTHPASSFSVVSPQQIDAVYGGSGSGYVTVRSPKGSTSVYGFVIPAILSVDPISATYLDTVSITGINFLRSESVWFGDSSALSFEIVNDSLIRAVVGSLAGDFIRVVKTPDTSFAFPFFYQPYVPDVLGFSPRAATTGESVAIRGRRFRNVNSVSFGGLPATAFTVVSDTLIMATPGTGAGGYIAVGNVGGYMDSLSGFTFLPYRPQVDSLQPSRGPVGMPVTIRGKRFGNIPADNLVFFGPAKATVLGGNDTSLQVLVPPGADYSSVCVLRLGLSSCSPQPFTTTFNGGMADFGNQSFDKPAAVKTPGDNPEALCYADFNGDGRTDLAVAYGFFGSNNNFISVLRNAGNAHFMRFVPALNLSVGSQGFYGYGITAGDINNDGKPDLVATVKGDNLNRIYINTSNADSISFVLTYTVVTGSSAGPEGTNPTNTALADFDGDGLLDMTFANYGLDNWCKVSFVRNTSVGAGALSFGARQDIPVVDASGVFVADMNNNRKKDVAVAIRVNGSIMRQIQLFNNSSIPGGIGMNLNEPAGTTNTEISYKLAFGDLDGDGRNDMVSANGNSNTLFVFRNLSAPNGLIEFDNTPLTFTFNGFDFNTRVASVAVSDMDGDGIPDLVVSGNEPSGGRIWLIKNASTPGNLNFGNPVAYALGSNNYEVAAADFDNDGRPDIAVVSKNDTSIRLLRNLAGKPLSTCRGGTVTMSSNISGTSYRWQASSDGGFSFADISNSAVYSGALTAALTLNNIQSDLTGKIFRCKVDNTLFSNTYTVALSNQWTGAVNQNWNEAGNWSCGTVPDTFTDVQIQAGTIVVSNNAACKSLVVFPGAALIIQTGVLLQVGP